MRFQYTGKSPVRTGFTLIEVLVVIALIAVLLGLMFPAVLRVHAAADRQSCQNNLHQLGIALHNYHSANDCFPVGQYNGIGENSSAWNRACWLHFTLPYLEQENLYNGYAVAGGNGSVLDAPNKDTVLRTLLCPSDRNSPKTLTTELWNGTSEGLHINYALCAGSTTYGNGLNLDGMFFVQSRTTLYHMQDTSNTLMASEILVVPDQADQNDMRGRYDNSWEGNTLFSTLHQPNTDTADVQHYAGISTTYAPWSQTGDNNLSARSSHPGGVNALLADGSVVFLPNNLNPAVYSAMGKVSTGVHHRAGPCVCGTGRCGGW